ncbi:hypothetical protein [Streptomyces sp. NPDC056405]|uniref:hypothetical protein n=1 Tax=Streptomyces sp. NPDC056405 TaxID=3345811 RepID=UPI0035D67074
MQRRQIVCEGEAGGTDFSGRSIRGVLPPAQAAEAVARPEKKEGVPIRLILRP